MKIEPPKNAESQKIAPAKEFQKILSEAAKKQPAARVGTTPKAVQPRAPAVKPVRFASAKPVVVVSSKLVVAQRAVQARSHAASQKLGDVLSKAHSQSAGVNQERSETRLRSGLEKAVQKEVALGADEKKLAAVEGDSKRDPALKIEAASGLSLQIHAASSTAPAERSTSAEQVETISKLVERIEAAVRDGQPSLKLSLTGTHAATVEVIRGAKGEVSVRIDGRGAQSRAALSEKISELKQGLIARGLTVKSIEIR